MKRIIRLLFLVLALPIAAWANSFSSSDPLKVFSMGDFESGTITGSISNGASFQLSVVGDSKTPFFFFDIGPLTQITSPELCNPLRLLACFTFSTGSIIIRNSLGAAVLSTSLIEGGLVERPQGPLFWILTYTLQPNFPLENGEGRQQFNFEGNTLTGGENRVLANFATVPEPSTLEGLLLGTGVLGLISLPGIMRRKQT